MHKNGNMISMLCLTVLGVVLIFFPGSALTTLIRVIGLVLVLIGGLRIYSEMTNTEKSVFFYAQITLYAVIALAGLIFLMNPGFIVSLFPIFMGAMIALTGVQNLMRGIECKNAGYVGWKQMVIVPVITICFGVLIFANPFPTMEFLVRIVGISLVYSGVSGLWLGRRR